MSDDRDRPLGDIGDIGDMPSSAFREAAHRVADRVADYLERLESYRVLPDVEPGEVRARFPAEPPRAGEPFDAILEDYARSIEPDITHWQHPGFMAYFPSVASGPGILGEWLAAGLNSNVMFWRNAPASTEVEEVVVAWLRAMVGLPDAFDGMLTDTASVSTLLSVTAARHAIPDAETRTRGLAGRPDLGPLRLYRSTEAHISVDKAAIVAGIGTGNVVEIPTDDARRMDADALAKAIARDRADGRVPFCVVATLGTTSSNAVDPAGAIADVCEREGVWLHVDAAYAGVAAIVPEMRAAFEGWERADSIVINPHKWMFTPFDASLLLFRDRDGFRDAFRLVPEYIKTPDVGEVHNFSEYGIQLGRRFRALKLWMQIRYFGVDGIAARIREHVRMARDLAIRLERTDGWELLAPVPFATLCCRYVPSARATAAEVDALNAEILDRVNASGDVFLSHTKLDGAYAIRVSIGNPRQEARHVDRCYERLVEAARVASSGGGGEDAP